MYIENKDKNLMSYLFDIRRYNNTSTDYADTILGTEDGITIWKQKNSSQCDKRSNNNVRRKSINRTPCKG